MTVVQTEKINTVTISAGDNDMTNGFHSEKKAFCPLFAGIWYVLTTQHASRYNECVLPKECRQSILSEAMTRHAHGKLVAMMFSLISGDSEIPRLLFLAVILSVERVEIEARKKPEINGCVACHSKCQDFRKDFAWQR